jgi:hypothetical protein
MSGSFIPPEKTETNRLKFIDLAMDDSTHGATTVPRRNGNCMFFDIIREDLI